MKKTILLLVLLLFAGTQIAVAGPAYYVASNIPVLIEGPTAPDSRDQALLKAEKIALSQFIPSDRSDKLKAVSDVTLARAMKDFSIQNERVLSQSYQAQFTIRFDPVRFEGLLRAINLPLPASREIDLANFKSATPASETVPAPVTDPGSAAETDPAATADTNAVILPVLDTGKKLVLWDEINAWRDAWQSLPASAARTHFITPLGDIADVTDAPDTGFLKQKGQPQPGLDNILQRYSAKTLYLVLAQNQPGGKWLGIKIYRYRDNVLDYGGALNPVSRPGYLFNDAAAAAAAQLDRLQQGQAMPPATDTASQPVNVIPLQNARSGPVIVTIPIANLAAWISLQQQLRQTPGVAALVPQSISANEAIVRIDSALPADQLIRNLQGNGFTVQPQGNGYTLFRQNG